MQDYFKCNGRLSLIISALLILSQLIVGLSCATLVDRVGRRPLFIVATAGTRIITQNTATRINMDIGMGVSFTLWTVCSALYDLHGNLAAGKAVVFFIFLHGIFYNIAWSGLLIAYTVEIMPYKLRAKGLMLMNFFVQAALVFNQ